MKAANVKQTIFDRVAVIPSGIRVDGVEHVPIRTVMVRFFFVIWGSLQTLGTDHQTVRTGPVLQTILRN